MEQVQELEMLIQRFNNNIKIDMDGYDVSIPLSVLAPQMPLQDSSTELQIIWRKGKMEMFLHPQDGIVNSGSILSSIMKKCEHKKALGSVLNVAIAEFRGEMTPGSLASITSATDSLSLGPTRTPPSDSRSDHSFSSRSEVLLFSSRLDEEYKWLSRLGFGDYGWVDKYLHKLSGLEQMLKLIFAEDKDDEIIKKEVEALCHVQHKNVLRYYAAWIQLVAFRPDPNSSKTDERRMMCISMEYCPSSLDKEVEKCASEQRDFSTQEMDRFFKEIGTGLAYIHSRGVCLRDLSPNNIFIDENGVAKIGDFGSAIILADGETTFLLDCPKKALYLPPESSIEGEVDNKVDCYTFGLILFQIMHPHMEKSQLIGVFDEAREGILPKRLTSTRLGKVVAGLLEKDSEKRFSIAEALRRYDMEY